MLVEMLIGRYAGEVKDVVPHAANMLIERGNARRVDGTSIPEAATVSPEERAVLPKAKTRTKRRKWRAGSA